MKQVSIDYIKQQRRHSKKRALERYGLEYSKEIKFQFVKWIQCNSHNALFIRRCSPCSSIFAVYYEGYWYLIIYDRYTKEVATFLPRNHLYKYRRRLYN